MDEFDLIRRYFVPLAERFPGALGLRDDAALIDVPTGQQLVVTKDAISAGVHFWDNEDAALTARRLLRVNLSDLAAKGAAPLCYFLALMLPKNIDEAWVSRFASGLVEDQKIFGIHLAGGDTTATEGSLALSLTALGTVPKGQMLLRSGAQAGDAIYVSGQLGDAAMSNWRALPEPRIALGIQLRERGIATASMDISDGLVQDLGHICNASNVGAVIEAERVPRGAADLETALTAGDDYELLFTAGPDAEEKIRALSTELGIALTRIGSVCKGEGVSVRNLSGTEIALTKTGYRHFR